MDATYGKSDGVKNAETFHAFGQYNRLFSERFFGYLRADYLHDGIADIHYQVTVGPGLGYYLIKETNTTLAVEAVPAWFFATVAVCTRPMPPCAWPNALSTSSTPAPGSGNPWKYCPKWTGFRITTANLEIGAEAAIRQKPGFAGGAG